MSPPSVYDTVILSVALFSARRLLLLLRRLSLIRRYWRFFTFPEDQKYAVYIPLFLPAMIPVLLSLKNIRRYYFSEKDNRKKKVGSHKESKEDQDNKLKVE